MSEPIPPLTGSAMPLRRLRLALLAVTCLTAAALYVNVAGRSVHAAVVTSPAARTPLPRLLRNEFGMAVADEFKAIRPADLDATAPPIPPSETWPAQR